MYRHNILIILLIFSFVDLIGQIPNHNLTGRINIRSLIVPIDTLNDYVVFNKKVVECKNGKRTFKEKAFNIDIPKGLNFRLCEMQSNVTKYYFSNDKENIVVEIHPQKRKGVIKGVIPNEKEDTLTLHKLKQADSDINIEKYFGFYFTGKYVIYYYNVGKDRLEFFNYAIQSLKER
jgi:hypothetical protein